MQRLGGVTVLEVLPVFIDHHEILLTHLFFTLKHKVGAERGG